MRSSWLLVAAAPLGALGIALGFPTAPARAVPRPVLPRSRTDLPVLLDPLDAEALLDKPDIRVSLSCHSRSAYKVQRYYMPKLAAALLRKPTAAEIGRVLR